MATGIDAYLTSYLSPYSWTSGASSSSSTSFDYSSALSSSKQKANDLLAAYNSSKANSASLQKDTATFLDNYTKNLKTLEQSASSIRGANLDKLLYDSSGSITDKTIKSTVDATQKFVDQYNSTLKYLNDNAERGPGTMKQLGRMVQDPAPASSMAMIGLSVNKDGTLALDQDKMTAAFKDAGASNQRLFRDILGGYGGVADSTMKNAQYGLNTSARDLITNDLATIKTAQKENPFREMYDTFRGGGAYYMNNQAVGVMMNLLV